MADAVGKFNCNAKFFTRYEPFFEAAKTLPADATVLVIGANDGVLADPSNRVRQDGWTGVFVRVLQRPQGSEPGWIAVGQEVLQVSVQPPHKV